MHHNRKDIFSIPFSLSLIILGFDFVALSISFMITGFYSSLLLGYDALTPDIDNYKYYIFCYALILFGFTYKGHYKNRVPFWQQARTIVTSVLSLSLATLVIPYIFNVDIFLTLTLMHWVSVIVLLILMRAIAFRILKKIKKWHLPVTLLGNNQMVIDCMYAFYNDGHTGYLVKTIMLRDRTKTPICLDFIPTNHPHIDVVDASADYLDYIITHRDNFYTIDMEGLRGKNRDDLITTLEDNNIDYAIAPSTKRLHLYGMQPLYFFGNDVMLLHRQDNRESPVNMGVKRVFDILCAAGLLIPLSLLAIFIYLNKKINHLDTPLFYGGPRLGKNGKIFPCWKFNTMKKDADAILDNLLEQDADLKAEWDIFQKLKNDPRIDSKLSALLRKCSLDELPQIWNVFVGDMSLVGPRPILPQQTKEYGDFINAYTSTRPGITGLWQVSGRNDTTFEQRIYWDGWYVKNWSLWHDCVILLKTVSVLISSKGAS